MVTATLVLPPAPTENVVGDTVMRKPEPAEVSDAFTCWASTADVLGASVVLPR